MTSALECKIPRMAQSQPIKKWFSSANHALVEGSNWMPWLILLAKTNKNVCVMQAHWKSLVCCSCWRGAVCKLTSWRHCAHWILSINGWHCAESSPVPAKKKQRYWSSKWQIVQFLFFIHSLCPKHPHIWLVRQTGQNCLLKCALWVTGNGPEEKKLSSWFLPGVQMQHYSHQKPVGPAWYKTKWDNKHSPWGM